MSRGPADFVRVSPTKYEIEEHIRRYGREPGVYRVQCVRCGKRIWGSGLGIGSHRRGCTNELPPIRDKHGVLHCRQCGSVYVEVDAIRADKDGDELVCHNCGVRELVPWTELWPRLYPKEA